MGDASDWPVLPAADSTTQSDVRRTVDRYGLASTVALIVASLMLVVGLVR